MKKFNGGIVLLVELVSPLVSHLSLVSGFVLPKCLLMRWLKTSFRDEVPVESLRRERRLPAALFLPGLISMARCVLPQGKYLVHFV